MRNFDINKALSGATIGFKNDKDEENNIYVYDFEEVTPGKLYRGIGSDNIEYQFYIDGSVVNNENLYLTIFEEKIVQDKMGGTTVTRTLNVEGETSKSEKISIDVLQPREQFAIAALQGILTNIPKPLLLNDKKIIIISKLAFKIAQSMLNVAAEYRAKTKEEGGEPIEKVEVDINSLTSSTDQILFNMSQSIDSIRKTIVDKEHINKIEVANVSAESIPVKVINTETEPIYTKSTDTNTGSGETV